MIGKFYNIMKNIVDRNDNIRDTGDLSNLHLFNWNEKDRIELYNIIVDKLYDEYRIKKPEIINVLATGSRTYKIGKQNLKLFRRDSDLDILVIIDTSLYIEIVSRTGKGKYPPRSFRDYPKLYPFTYKKVKISTFILPADSNPHLYQKWRFPLTDLLTLKVDGKYEYDLMDYMLNVKSRINPYKFCFLCKEEKDSSLFITYTIVDENLKVDESGSFSICRSCFDNLIKASNITDKKYKLVGIIDATARRYSKM